MGVFGKNKMGGLMDEIRCDESSYLIWKWHPKDSVAGKNDRENAIRLGSSLRVKEGEVAVFVYKQKNSFEDFIVGPYDQIIKTANLPGLASILGMAYDGGTPFQAEVYFINLAKIIQTKFAVPFFDVFDPRFADFSVPIAVRGTISFKIEDYREFIKLHRLINFDLSEFERQIRDAIIRYAKNSVANAPTKNNIPVIQIETKTSLINEAIEYDVSERLREDFGVIVSGVDIGAIEIDKSSEGYKQLLAVTKDVTTATIQAQTETNVKNIHDMQRIEAENYQEALRIQREEGQYATHKQTQSSNFPAYQMEAQTQVGIAGAEALGQMGANGAGGVNLGEGGTGFNPAAMMAGMAVGGAVGQNIAGVMNGMISPTNLSGATPPPIPSVTYNVVINGQSAGPFDLAGLQQMVNRKELSKEDLVWRQGMAQWQPAGSVDELKMLFQNGMPPIPNTGSNQ